MVRAGRGRGTASVNQTRPHCVNQTGKAHSRPLAARRGTGAAWARHAMCESAFREPGGTLPSASSSPLLAAGCVKKILIAPTFGRLGFLYSV
jgi:hypothetical protein